MGRPGSTLAEVYGIDGVHEASKYYLGRNMYRVPQYVYCTSALPESPSCQCCLFGTCLDRVVPEDSLAIQARPSKLFHHVSPEVTPTRAVRFVCLSDLLNWDGWTKVTGWGWGKCTRCAGAIAGSGRGGVTAKVGSRLW